MRVDLRALLFAVALGCSTPREQMDRACQDGDVEAVEKLLAKAPELAKRKGNGIPPLHETKSRKVAELLLASGAELNEQDSAGRKAIHMAMSAEVVDLLVERGADVRSGFGPYGKSALHSARSVDGIEALLRHGLAPNVLDLQGQSALFAQATVEAPSTPALLKALVAAGLDVNARASDGLAPLYIASPTGIATLAALGANLEVRLPRSGATPLHSAAFAGADARVEALLKAGANPNARLPADAILDMDGQGFGPSVANATPLKLAKTDKSQKLLKKAGGTY